MEEGDLELFLLRPMPTPRRFAPFCVSLVLSLAIYGTMVFCLLCLSFWLIKMRNFFWLIYNLAEFAKYPTGVYRGAIRVLLTTVLPLVLLFHFPVMVLVGHGDMELLAYRLGVLGGFCFSAEASGGPGFVATAAPGDSGSSPR
ncbi:hypothetical protein DRJ58_03740 [Candidatus Acetothermia bacterium]|nr:MAG: hypothetical protein DRJ58_03740 [Candidatus Acetothermia bacterium]